MHPRHACGKFMGILLALLTATATGQVRFNSPQPGEVYREYIHVMDDVESQVRDPNIDTSKFPYLYAPPIYLQNVDLNGAVRAEAVIIYLGGHVSTIGQKMKWNGSDWIDIPLLDASNGIPAGHQGYDYLMLHDLTMDVPLSLLKNGTNWFQGTSGTQGDPRYSFGWGQWGWAAIILRIYYGSGTPHAAGVISSHSTGGSLNDNPTIAASVTSGSATQIDFLAYYDDYDTDGDGVYLQYHHDYMMFLGQSNVTIRNHVGTATNAPWSVTWNTDWVPDQPAGQVKLVARIRDSNGMWYVTPEVTGLTLNRSGFSVKLYRPLDMPERCWVKGDVDQGYGYGHQVIHFNIPSSDNLGNATAARYYIRTWNGLNGVEGDPTPYSEYRHLNGWSDTKFGADHGYSFDIRTIPVSALLSGTNTWHWYNTVAVHHGIEVEWPGPVLAVRYSGTPSNNPPSITAQPTDQTVAEGLTATFTVAATGTGTLSYQWQKNRSDIGGATSQSYTTPVLAIADSGALYRCVVTNTYGSATSNEALLSVIRMLPPTITIHPASQTVQDGQPAAFSVTATGTAPLTYQWQKNAANITGATATTYNITAAAYADSGAQFRCVVSNAKGADTSHTAVLHVSAVAPMITTHPANVQVSPGDTAVFTVVATGSLPRYYEWQRNGTPVTGATAASYSFVAVKEDSGAAFRCKVTNGAGSVTSNAAYLIVGTFPPTITAHPVQAFVQLGHTATFSVSATGTRPLTYQWQRDSVDIPAAAGPSYTTPPVVLDDNGRSYRCVVTNSYGSAISESATLSVTSDVVNLIANGGFELGTTPWVFFTNGSGSFANDSAGPTSQHAAHLWISTAGNNMQLSQTPVALVADTAYTLLFKAYSSSGHDMDVSILKNTNPYTNYGLSQHPCDLGTVWANYRADFTAAGFSGSISDGRVMFWFVPYGTAGDRYFVDDVVLVKTSTLIAPTITKQPTGKSVREGEIATFSVAVTGTTPITYQWEKNQVAIPGATSAAYTTPPVTAADDNAQFRCVATNIVGSVTSDPAVLSVTITNVNPSPELKPAKFYLAQNHPNPFNPSTAIEFGVPTATHVTLKVVNLLGQEVKTLVDDYVPAGTHQVTFHADALPSGIYLYRMEAGNFFATKKLVLIK